MDIFLNIVALSTVIGGVALFIFSNKMDVCWKILVAITIMNIMVILVDIVGFQVQDVSLLKSKLSLVICATLLGMCYPKRTSTK